MDQKEEEVDPGSTQEVKVQPQVLNDEVRVLRDQIMDEKMSKRGIKAMERSQRSRRKAAEMFSKYTTNYRHLAATGDKGLVKAWSKANRMRENWMNPERFQAIPEEEEPPPEPPEKTKIEATAVNPTEIPEEGTKSSGLGRVRKLTDFFNQIGGPKPPKGPKTPNKAPKTK